MKDLDRYLQLCDPLPERGATATGLTRAVQGVVRTISDTQRLSPWEIAEGLAQISVRGWLGSDLFSTRVSAAIRRALPNASGCDSLFGAVCVMSAAIRLLASSRLSAERKVSRRDSMAVALWSALSFQKPLAEQRLEDVRADLMTSARLVGLKLGQRSWRRRTVRPRDSPEAQDCALKWNAVLYQEEIKVLRWSLANESTLLVQPYAEIGCGETVALTRGLELGLLLDKFPEFTHYQLAVRDVPPQSETDLDGLLAAVGEHRRLLAGPFEGSPMVGACPRMFPLLTALTGEPTGRAEATVQRPLRDWCGRALIESAIFNRSKTVSEG